MIMLRLHSIRREVNLESYPCSQPLRSESIGQVDGHYDQGEHRRLAVALGDVDTSDEENQDPLDISDAEVVSYRSDSVPALEGGPGLSDEEESVGSEQDQWGRMGERGDSLQTAVAAWDK
jgi:hypothetical protein